jgi:hypothetical protein
MLGEMREREKREEEELREERELAAWVAATRAESYARFNMRLPTPEEEAAFARDHAHEIDLSVLKAGGLRREQAPRRQRWHPPSPRLGNTNNQINQSISIHGFSS